VQIENLVWTPARVVHERHNRLEVIRAGIAHGNKFLVLKESAPYVVFLQHRNVWLAHDLLRLYPEIESAL